MSFDQLYLRVTSPLTSAFFLFEYKNPLFKWQIKTCLIRIQNDTKRNKQEKLRKKKWDETGSNKKETQKHTTVITLMIICLFLIWRHHQAKA